MLMMDLMMMLMIVVMIIWHLLVMVMELKKNDLLENMK